MFLIIFFFFLQISAKDMSLLEERIKRANKRPPNVAKVESVTVPLIAGQPINVQESAVTSSDNHMVQNDEEDSDNDDLPEVAYVIKFLFFKYMLLNI